MAQNDSAAMTILVSIVTAVRAMTVSVIMLIVTAMAVRVIMHVDSDSDVSNRSDSDDTDGGDSEIRLQVAMRCWSMYSLQLAAARLLVERLLGP